MGSDSPAAIAIRLAHEGVPMRAIARATDIPSTKLYETLVEAKLDGRLLSLPRDDWPPGCPWDQRSLQLARLISESHDSLLLATQSLFSMSPTAARLMLLLVQYERVPRDRVDLDNKSFNVHICAARKCVAAFNLTIKTLWGYGYQLEDRKKAMGLILDHAGLTAAKA